MWARGIDKQLCTIEEPSDDVRLAILRSKAYADAQKSRREAASGGIGGSEIADLTRLLIVGQLKQLTGSQPPLTAQTAPSQQPEAAVTSPPSASWVPIETVHWMESFLHTEGFFKWLYRRKVGLPRTFLRTVFECVVIVNRVDINMLNDNSKAGITKVVWAEQYAYPAGTLLLLRKQAIEWQKQYKGLTEEQLAQLEKEKEKERVELEDEAEDDLSLADFPAFYRAPTDEEE